MMLQKQRRPLKVTIINFKEHLAREARLWVTFDIHHEAQGKCLSPLPFHGKGRQVKPGDLPKVKRTSKVGEIGPVSS